MAEHGVTEATIGYFFTYIGVLNIVMRVVLLGPIVERVGETCAMRLGAAALIVGLLAYPAAQNLWQLLVVIPLVPIGTALLFPATTALMSRYSDKAEIGHHHGGGADLCRHFAGGRADRRDHHLPAGRAQLAVHRGGRHDGPRERTRLQGGATARPADRRDAGPDPQGGEMSDDERIARLEQRLQVLEGLVRQLITAGDARPAPSSLPPPPPPDAARAARTPPSPPVAHRPPPPPPPPPRSTPAARSASAAPLLTEQWLGQRGLLAVGVIFVILAAGYLLKLSFDRGWISPLARCIGGALAGGAVGALGWRLHGRGTRTYGAALIGLGAAIIYLAVWAAARLYQFLPSTPAIAGWPRSRSVSPASPG